MLAKWLTRVHDKVVKLTGVKEATVVWGVKRVSARRCRLRQAAVAPTGRGNIPVPTHRITDVVKTIKGWTVVSGDEYRTSAASCLPAHTDAIAPRFRGKTEKVARKRAATFTGRVRGGYVVGMRHRRLIKRHDTYEAGALTDDALVRMCEGVPHHVQHEMKRVKMDEKTTWVYDGHAGESAKIKAARKLFRELGGFKAKYVRGLRVCQDGIIMKLVDRDVNARQRKALPLAAAPREHQHRLHLDQRQRRGLHQARGVRPGVQEEDRCWLITLPAQNSGCRGEKPIDEK